jgi:hypothetical protein
VITVKKVYGLAVDPREATALRRALGGCPAAPKPAPTTP